MNTSSLEKYYYWSLILILAILLIGTFIFSCLRVISSDEFEFLHGGWKTFFDSITYKCSFEYHQPLLISISKIFCPIPIVRLLTYIMLLGIGTLAYATANLFLNKSATLLSLIILYSIPVMAHTSPNIPVIFFAIASIAAWLHYLETQKTILLIASPLLLGATWLFLLKTTYTLLPLGLLILITLPPRNEPLSVKTLISFGLLFLLFPLTYMIFSKFM